MDHDGQCDRGRFPQQRVPKIRTPPPPFPDPRGERDATAASPQRHEGEPLQEDGDLFGSTVILASRIAARAGAGEILVPDTVRGLLSGKNFLFLDRGEFVPKGFEDAMRLYEVRWRE